MMKANFIHFRSVESEFIVNCWSANAGGTGVGEVSARLSEHCLVSGQIRLSQVRVRVMLCQVWIRFGLGLLLTITYKKRQQKFTKYIHENSPKTCPRKFFQIEEFLWTKRNSPREFTNFFPQEFTFSQEVCHPKKFQVSLDSYN